MSDKVVERALSSLGKGFDLTSDFRLKYCKGRERLVVLNETETRDILVPGFGSYNGVSVDIKCDKGERTRYQSDILGFNQMSELFNHKCSGPGKIPTGHFNAMFGLDSGSWATDAANTKYLGFDGYFISLFNAHIDRYPLILSEEVRNAVPSVWDPAALARFIENYGTHIIVGVSIGGQDVLIVKQENSSNMEPSKLKNHLYDLGDQFFNGSCSFPPYQKTKDQKAPWAINFFDPQASSFNGICSSRPKNGVSVMCSKRGGDVTVNTHCEWLLTVPSLPDAINFSFIPITSLLKDVPGKGFLSHAINLYLRYKPHLSEFQYFLDFQSHMIWAPVHNDLSLGPTSNMTTRKASLPFNLIGPKLYVNTSQVTVGRRPVTGMRLYLEGKKCNRLAIHLQHLSDTPVLLQDKMENAVTWCGSEEVGDTRYFEPIQWKMLSHVCTAPVKYDPQWNADGADVIFVVTGAQLHVEKHDSKSVLHLRLSYSKISRSFIAQSNWVQCSSEQSKSGFLSAISTSLSGNQEEERATPKVVVNSGVFPTGPPVQVQAQKLLKFVDMTQLCRGPLDSPGHWLVTGAKLQLERGKICLHVKFSLLNIV